MPPNVMPPNAIWTVNHDRFTGEILIINHDQFSKKNITSWPIFETTADVPFRNLQDFEFGSARHSPVRMVLVFPITIGLWWDFRFGVAFCLTYPLDTIMVRSTHAAPWKHPCSMFPFGTKGSHLVPNRSHSPAQNCSHLLPKKSHLLANVVNIW